jgi:hypothetical protein
MAIYELKIQLEGATKPPIWRKVLVKAEDPLAKLHCIIQAAMGWYNSHLHQFIVNGQYYEVPMAGSESDAIDANEITLQQAFGNKVKATIKYEYDFGDGWLHKITLEKTHQADANITYPHLLDGKGACPPEDCGGVWGYEDLKATLADPESEDYEDMLEWLDLEDGSEFDPNEFDLEEHRAEVLQVYENGCSFFDFL